MNTDNIISFEEKKVLLYQCLPVVKKFLIEKNNEKFKGGKSHYFDAINSVKNFERDNFKYKYVFFYSLALTPYFLDIKKRVVSGNLDLSEIKDPYYWERNNISLDIAVFFSSSFIGELYKDDLKKDFETLKIMNSVNEYYIFREKIIKKSKDL